MRRLTGLVIVVTLLSAALPAPGVVLAQEPVPQPDGELAAVVDVIDGDTIRVERQNGEVERVRYIGIDTPELTDEDEEGPEPYSRQAELANGVFVKGQDVILETDTSDRDKFDRLLRYVWVETEDGWVMVNERLVALGLATVRSYEPDTRRDALLRQSEGQAKLTGRGMYDPDVLTRGLVGAEAMGYLFADAYEARDVSMLRRLMRRNVTYVTPDGERYSGKAAVIARFREEWTVLDPAITIRRSIAQPDVVLLDLIIHVYEDDSVVLSEGPDGVPPESSSGIGRRFGATALQRWPNDRLSLYRLFRDD